VCLVKRDDRSRLSLPSRSTRKKILNDRPSWHRQAVPRGDRMSFRSPGRTAFQRRRPAESTAARHCVSESLHSVSSHAANSPSRSNSDATLIKYVRRIRRQFSGGHKYLQRLLATAQPPLDPLRLHRNRTKRRLASTFQNGTKHPCFFQPTVRQWFLGDGTITLRGRDGAAADIPQEFRTYFN